MLFSQAIKSYLGFLEGTKKTSSTLKNYQLDLISFQKFWLQQYDQKQLHLKDLSRKDFFLYEAFLRESRLQSNTQRRKLLTLSQFLSYHARRKKIAPELAQKIPTPHKIERIPFTLEMKPLLEKVQHLPFLTSLQARNRALLWTLMETGCLVSEVVSIRQEQWVQIATNQAILKNLGKSNRTLTISNQLFEAICNLHQRNDLFSKKLKDFHWSFLGCNQYGALGTHITPRGVELLVKHYRKQLGHEKLTPRILRHSVILNWLIEGVPNHEIQKRLGLKTLYTLRLYQPLILAFKSNESATSIE